jgi:acetyl esterase
MAQLDPEVAAVLERLKSEGLNLRSAELSPSEARAARAKQPAWLRLPMREMARVEDRIIPGPGGPLAIRICTPRSTAGSGAPPVALFFHSGAFVFGSLDSDDPQCRRIAAESGCILVSVDYRLAPENKFPAAYDDAIAAWHWITTHAREIGGDGKRFAMSGASAGGNLSVGICKHARDLDGPKPRFQLIFVGSFHVSHPLPSHALRDRNGSGRAYSEFVNQAYRRSEADINDPRYAPLIGSDFRGMPPAMIITAECDAFSDEGALYAEKLRDCGVPAELYCARGQIHQVFSWAGAFPEGPRVLDRGAAALCAAMQALAKPATPTAA